jgi:hypothetical protein
LERREDIKNANTKNAGEWIWLIDGINTDMIAVLGFGTIVGRELGFVEPDESIKV